MPSLKIKLYYGYVCIGKTVHIGFSTIRSFSHALGVLECISMNKELHSVRAQLP